MLIPLEQSPEFDKDFFEKVEDEQKGNHFFQTHIRTEYEYESGQACLYPVISSSALNDVHACYMDDITRLSKMLTEPDHFKRAGIMAYWLRRHNPVFKFQKGDGPPPIKPSKNQDLDHVTDLLIEYGHVYLAFAAGYKICAFFESERSVIPEPDKDYIDSICYLMKYKSISPHALGFIYRSLFFGRPKPPPFTP